MTTIDDNLKLVQQRLVAACNQYGRTVTDIRLLAVSKTFPAQAVKALYEAGQTAFGENYVQEALDKIALLRHLPIEWHCIVPLQSNKTRAVAEHFDWVHSVDRLKIAQRLSEQRPPDLPELQVCIQVNIDAAATKSGVPPAQVAQLARQIVALPRLRLRGIMTIPEPHPDFAQMCALHAQAKALFDRLRLSGLDIDTLSMGMSADLEAAVASGSTLVRVGSALFGDRAIPAKAPEPLQKP